MASKVLIKMPTVSFSSAQQALNNKASPELVAVGHAAAVSSAAAADGVGTCPAMVLSTMSTDPLLRISQLEQNIRFLHDQHQTMLSSLHNEVEMLRQRNRDLQYQLVFTKKNAIYGGLQTSSESSPDEESSKSKVITISPSKKNIINLQVEMLEKEMADLNTTLTELNDRNSNLTKLLSEQAQRLEEAMAKETEYECRLDDADKLIKRLRRENDDQKHEINMLRAQLIKDGSVGAMSGGKRPGSGGGSRRTNGGSGGASSPGGGGANASGGKDRNCGSAGSGASGGRDNGPPGSAGGSGAGGMMPPQQENSGRSIQQHNHHRFPPLYSQQYRQRSPRQQQNSDQSVGRPQSSGNNNGRNNVENPGLPHLQQQQIQQRHYNSYNSGQQNKGGNHHGNSGGNRYYNNGGGGRHYNNQQHYYYNYKGGNNNRSLPPREHPDNVDVSRNQENLPNSQQHQGQ